MTDRAPLPPDWLRTEARRLYGTDPLGYEAGRPEYPERVYQVLRERCGLGPGCRVLEIGPGTGRVTQRALDLGASVVAIEPDAALAAYLANRFGAKRLQVVRGLFEDAPLEENGFDLAMSAMSFHWVDQEVGLSKLGRVIRPGGWAAVWWTVFGDPARADAFHERTKYLLEGDIGPVAVDLTFELDIEQRRLDLSQRAGLVDVEAELIQWTARMGATEVRALYASMIRILRQPQLEQQRVLDELVAITNGEFNGIVQRPFVTALYTARRA
jgi:SAM-dependent methyltransferase